jgi:hypothetical protein
MLRKYHLKDSGKIIERLKLHESHIITFFFILLCLVGMHCGFYKGSNNISYISYLNLPPPTFFFSPHSRVSITVFFSFYIMCVQVLHYIHPFVPFPNLFPIPCIISLSRQVLFCPPPILWFCERKEKEMTLFLPALHAYIYFLYIAFH